MNAEFLEQISNSNASIKSRQGITNIVLLNQELLKDVIKLTTDIEYKFHYKAVWITELIAETSSNLLSPFVDDLLAVAPKYKHESAIRGISRALFFICKSKAVKLTEQQQNKCIEICFDWLINSKIRIAPKVFAIYTLELFYNKYPWVKKDLVSIIENDYQNQSSGYKAAAKRVLKNINL
jgi:hypothetical protein